MEIMNFALLFIFTIFLNSVQSMDSGFHHPNEVPREILRRQGAGNILKIAGSLYIVSKDCTHLRPATATEKETYDVLKFRNRERVIRHLPFVKLLPGDLLIRGESEIGVVLQGHDYFTDMSTIGTGQERRIDPENLDKLKRYVDPLAVYENDVWVLILRFER